MRLALMNGNQVETIIETDVEDFSIPGMTLIDVTDRPDVVRGWYLTAEGFAPRFIPINHFAGGYYNIVSEELVLDETPPILEDPALAE